MPVSGMWRRLALVKTTLRWNYVFLCSVLRFLVVANAVSSSPILVVLMTEVIRSSEIRFL
jgi:hypothetical protein